MSANGSRRPPRPQIELVTPPTSESEAAAIVAALEQFLAESAPGRATGAGQARPSRWQRAALEEGVSARQLSGRSWGDRSEHR